MKKLLIIISILLTSCGGGDSSEEHCITYDGKTICCTTYCDKDGKNCHTYC